MNALPLNVDDWETVLRETVAPELQAGYREAIIKFRYWLRQADRRPDVQDLLGHADISTTEIYLHTANQTGIGVRSPFDSL